MGIAYPPIGKWFRRPNGVLFEVVAIDDDDHTIEIQYYDGTIDEFDLESWPKLMLVEAHPPEDWSWSVDMDSEDDVDPDIGDMPIGYHDPFEFIED